MPPISTISSARLIGHSLLLFFAGLLLGSISSKHPVVARGGQSLVATIASPIQSGMGAVANGVEGLWDQYINLFGLVHENKQLKERLLALETENSKLLEFGAENERLKRILSLKEAAPIEGVTANVIGFDPTSWMKGIVIDKGSNQGLAKGQSVVDGKGVVGHISSVSGSSARVILMNDHASAVDAIIQRTRARGVVAGNGSRTTEMNYVLEREDVKIGDRVITSGFDGIFPKGLFVGVVTEVDPPSRKLFRRIEIEPASDLSKLESVLVVTKVSGEIPESSPANGSASEVK